LKVLITTVPFGDKDRRPMDMLEAVGAEIHVNPTGRKLTELDLARMIETSDIVIAGTEPITDLVLSKATRLKLISRVGIGLDNVDLLAARARGVRVCYTPDAPSPAVAELTIGLMIDLLRFIHVSNQRMRRGDWYRYFGRRLSEVTIGIVGVGRIGGRVLEHLAGFSCRRILVNDIKSSVSVPSHPTCRIEHVDKDTLYRESDVISFHVPLTGITRNLVTRKEMLSMKPGTVLVNTARGGIVNESNLFEVLESGHLGGAAIDVFDREPYFGKLADLDQCLLTAHMGSMSIDCRVRMEIEATEEAVRMIRDEPLRSEVPQVEYENQSFAE
jgi:D-3-phosphoglycerate dehydrogenase / 2-oxoglutarate reductase